MYISGTVTDSGGSPLSSVEVDVFDDFGFLGYTFTSADGTYYAQVPPGNYTLGFYDWGGRLRPGLVQLWGVRVLT